MIADILVYISSYEEIRAVCGINKKDELPDTTLALRTYANALEISLNAISGVYSPETESQTLKEIFDRPLLTDDPMYPVIQQYAIYSVANTVMDSIGLRAYKTIADGKSSLTRFSPESTYIQTRKSIQGALNGLIGNLLELLGQTAAEYPLIRAVPPDVDLVTGE